MENNNSFKNPKFGSCTFSVAGKVTKKESKFSAKGNQVTNVLVSTALSEDKGGTYLRLVAFNDSKNPDKKEFQLAENVDNQVEEGKGYWFRGNITNNNYKDPKTEKMVYGFTFSIRYFGVIEENSGEKSSTNNIIKMKDISTSRVKEDIPF